MLVQVWHGQLIPTVSSLDQNMRGKKMQVINVGSNKGPSLNDSLSLDEDLRGHKMQVNNVGSDKGPPQNDRAELKGHASNARPIIKGHVINDSSITKDKSRGSKDM